MYDTASTISVGGTKECSLLAAVTESLVDRSNTIVEAWRINPWSELDTKAWHAEYLAMLSNQLDYSMKKLSRPLAKIGSPRPYFSESWRSNSSLSNLKENIIAMQSLYLAQGEGLDDILRAEGEAALADNIVDQFEDTLKPGQKNRACLRCYRLKRAIEPRWLSSTSWSSLSISLTKKHQLN